jgi:hypothetical protein
MGSCRTRTSVEARRKLGEPDHSVAPVESVSALSLAQLGLGTRVASFEALTGLMS